MLDGRPTIVVSYSVGFQNQVAKPVAERLEPHGFRAVLVGEEPLPLGVESTPNSKIDWFFHCADMAVFLATPDDRLESGTTQTRQNIIDEHRLGYSLPHLRRRLMVFKAKDVTLPSNINPVHERLPLDDPDWIVGKIVEQARAWGLLQPVRVPADEAVPTSSADAGPNPALPGGVDGAALAQAVASLEGAITALQGGKADREQLLRAELV